MALQELTVRITLSPLQWGEKPGSLRFSVHGASDRIAIGSFSVGGMAAYKLRERIFNEVFLQARVIKGPSRKFVLTHLMGDDGWLEWKVAFKANKAFGEAVDEFLLNEVSLPHERRGAKASIQPSL